MVHLIFFSSPLCGRWILAVSLMSSTRFSGNFFIRLLFNPSLVFMERKGTVSFLCIASEKEANQVVV